ncbi:MAG: leucyl/phenylalanyl-tRNA--protein transferase [Bacteroidetes bacterium]|nr:MAG: leucyl/phenylalanyl-tRNA--protein transferase [Bacteroidota bacterium]
MPGNKRVVYLKDDESFPPVSESLADGLLAAGGDLGEKRLLTAYKSGIFPWYDEYSPILWYSPKRRCIFRPDGFIVSHSLKQKLNNQVFTFTMDQNFAEVITACAHTRRKQEDGTWILPEMIYAYTQLHKSGYAHSVEVWHKGNLAGGLYGVSMGKAFFGESMFHKVTDASKAALHYLCNWLLRNGFHFIDAQMETRHLVSLGAFTVSRDIYLKMLNEAMEHTTLKGPWKNIQSP